MEKAKLKEIFLVIQSTPNEILIIPLISFYVGYIDRPKLTEQRNIWAYSPHSMLDRSR